MSRITVTDLFRFPVKSLRGQALDQAAIGPRGIDGDRRWMLIDDTGRFLTRRELPDMALFDVQPLDGALILRHPIHGSHHVRTPHPDDATVDARIWGDTVRVQTTDATITAYLSGALGRQTRLVYQADSRLRAVDPGFAAPGDQVNLSDGFPILIVAEESLAALNAELNEPVAMMRFRPNIVIAGAGAWHEDRWRRIRIGTVTFRLPKPCSRCIVTTQDPLTGKREHGNEPLATLRRIGRMGKGGVMFGQNALPETIGTIAIGDPVDILMSGNPNLGKGA